jgi:hypothetical protein
LEKQLQLHKSLYQLSLEKTEVLKKGDIDAIILIIKNEKTHINAIQVIEKERKEWMSKWFPDREKMALADCLPHFDQSDREKITSIHQEFVVELDQLKVANGLNRELLEQSLQFASLNLELLLPKELSNYTKENDEEDPMPQYSLFDSKA